MSTGSKWSREALSAEFRKQHIRSKILVHAAAFWDKAGCCQTNLTVLRLIPIFGKWQHVLPLNISRLHLKASDWQWCITYVIHWVFVRWKTSCMNAASISVTKLRFWVERFESKFAGEIRKNRAGQHSNWQWHLDEFFVKINGERFYLWRAVDHEGEVLECYVTKRRNKAAAKKFLIKKCENTDHPRSSRQTSWRPMAWLFVRLAL